MTTDDGVLIVKSPAASRVSGDAESEIFVATVFGGLNERVAQRESVDLARFQP